ncbi:MAG: hypothetical protein ACYTG0_34005, partial [Planctomycetota bacterium]
MSLTRAANIVLRTAHIVAMGILLGGVAFEVERERLFVSLWLTIGSGVALAALEAGPRLLWFHQVRGLVTMGKLVVIGAVPFAWECLPILLAVAAAASIGSHMPARFRYYSVLLREVIPDASGPGTAQLGSQRDVADGPSRGTVVDAKCERCDRPSMCCI